MPSFPGSSSQTGCFNNSRLRNTFLSSESSFPHYHIRHPHRSQVYVLGARSSPSPRFATILVRHQCVLLDKFTHSRPFSAGLVIVRTLLGVFECVCQPAFVLLSTIYYTKAEQVSDYSYNLCPLLTRNILQGFIIGTWYENARLAHRAMF